MKIYTSPGTQISAADLTCVYRGDVYGHEMLFAEEGVAAHIASNDIDRDASRRWNEGDALVALALLGFRETRAYLGAFGVAPAYRGRHLARHLLNEALDVACERDAASIELEVRCDNPVAKHLYEQAHFETIDELIVWEREARGECAPLPVRDWDLAEVEAIVSAQSCWQREPRSIVKPRRCALLEIDGAYAFVRYAGGYAVLADVGARDDASAHALLDALDEHICVPIHLLNEPHDTPLSRAFTKRGWRATMRQYRMKRDL